MWKTLPEEDQDSVISYVDGILITPRTRNQCIERTQTVLKIIEKMEFMVNPAKAQLCQDTVHSLGLELNSRGLCPNTSTIQMIQNQPVSEDVTTLE